MESLEKSLKDLEKSKAEAVEALIKKKDEEIHAAYQGWLSETNKKVCMHDGGFGIGREDRQHGLIGYALWQVEAVERKLHEEHQAELRELEGRMKEMQQELVERTTTLQQLTGRYDESVKVGKTETKRRRLSVVRWYGQRELA